MSASAPVVVGLVGRIAAGKSTVARALGALGAEVLDADAFAHEALDEPAVRDAVVARFGTGVLRDGARVDRRALATVVFRGDGAALAELESIVHPRVRRRIDEALERVRTLPARDDGRRRVVVLDVPLLMQAGWDGICDRLLHVTCDETVRRRRIADRGWSNDERDRRDAAWNRGYRDPPAEKTAVVDASRDLAYIQEQIGRFWQAVA